MGKHRHVSVEIRDAAILFLKRQFAGDVGHAGRKHRQMKLGHDRSLPMRGTKTPNSPHPSIIPESSRFGLVALAVTLLFLWIALTEQTILRLHPSNHTRLRSGGLKLQIQYDQLQLQIQYDQLLIAKI